MSLFAAITPAFLDLPTAPTQSVGRISRLAFPMLSMALLFALAGPPRQQSGQLHPSFYPYLHARNLILWQRTRGQALQKSKYS